MDPQFERGEVEFKAELALDFGTMKQEPKAHLEASTVFASTPKPPAMPSYPTIQPQGGNKAPNHPLSAEAQAEAMERARKAAEEAARLRALQPPAGTQVPMGYPGYAQRGMPGKQPECVQRGSVVHSEGMGSSRRAVAGSSAMLPIISCGAG